MDKLHISNEMRQFDSKNRNFYDELTDEEKKKFSPFLMIRWGSTVTGSPELQEYYLISTNLRLNKNFFDIHRHPKLQWLCATTVSPAMGNFRHEWISTKKKEKADPMRKKLMELYPTYKEDEIDLLCEITTKEEFKKYMRDLGNEK